MKMHIKSYTEEEIRNNIQNVVYLHIDISNSRYSTKPLEITKVTEKTFKINSRFKKTVRFAEVGIISNGIGYFMENDVEDVVNEYKNITIRSLTLQIEEAKKQIQRMNELKKIDS